MKQILLLLTAMLFCCCSSDNEVKADVPSNVGKTLVVYYSYTGNCREIVNTLTSQMEADVLEIQPAEKGQKYEANNYALGTQLLNAIKANPNNASTIVVEPDGCHHADLSLSKRFANGRKACGDDCVECQQRHLASGE